MLFPVVQESTERGTAQGVESRATPDDPEFRECWALSNLQPLWAKDNMSKHARTDWQKECLE